MEHTLKKYLSKKSTDKKRTHIPVWQFTVLLICIPTFSVSTFFFFDNLFRYRAEDSANVQLAQAIQVIREMQKTNDYPEATYDKFTEYDALWEKNHDFAGWLFIDDTRIDYPVMHTPDDPEYYLHRAFDRSDAISGSLFMDASYSADGNSILIHGHHMKDGSMFGSLTNYKSYDFAMEHPIIHFDTLTEERDYEVFAAFYWNPSYDSETDEFLYYEYSDLSSQEVFNKYMNQVKSRSIYDTGVSASYGDNILMLSTCSYHDSNGRFVVIAVKH